MKKLVKGRSPTFVPAMLLVAVPAMADAPAKSQADIFYDEGVAAADRKQWLTAAALFEKSFAADPVMITLAQWGRALVMVGNYVDGADKLERFTREAKDAPPELVTEVQGLLRQAKENIVSVSVDIDQGGATLFVDGKRIEDDRSAFPVYLLPGNHSFEARKDGFVTATDGGKFAAGENVRIRLKLVPVEVKTQAPAMGKPRRMDPIAIGLGIGGGLVLAGGIATGIAALATASTMSDLKAKYDRLAAPDGHCYASQCTPIYDDYESRAHRLPGLTIASIAMTAVGATGLTYGIVRSRPSTKKTDSGKVSVMVSPMFGGMAVMGNF